jgi:hypothetical protein
VYADGHPAGDANGCADAHPHRYAARPHADAVRDCNAEPDAAGDGDLHAFIDLHALRNPDAYSYSHAVTDADADDHAVRESDAHCDGDPYCD